MESTCLVDDAEFWLPPEFLTDDDFLVEKENKESNKYEPSHGFGFEDDFLTGLTQKMVQSTLQDGFSGGNHAFPAKAWGTTRFPQTRVSSQAAAAAWDLYCAATEELAMINLNGYNNNLSGGRGLLDLHRKQPLSAAAKTPNDGGSGFYSRQSLQYQKLQAIQFQQQQLMKHRRHQSAWQQSHAGSGMRAVFLGDRTGKRGSTGTGVFLPRRVNQTSPVTSETREKPTLATVLVPARVARVLNLDDSVSHQPAVPASASLNGVSWRQRSNNGGFSSQMKIEQTVNEPRLPSDWAY